MLAGIFDVMQDGSEYGFKAYSPEAECVCEFLDIEFSVQIELFCVGKIKHEHAFDLSTHYIEIPTYADSIAFLDKLAVSGEEVW